MVQWLRLCTYTAWECEFNSWLGTYDLTCHSVAKKILKKKKEKINHTVVSILVGLLTPNPLR